MYTCNGRAEWGLVDLLRMMEGSKLWEQSRLTTFLLWKYILTGFVTLLETPAPTLGKLAKLALELITPP